ncbi:MAG: hypothetical protein LBV32_04285, partial [Tannerellaceae bacterium]|nr:hypothetical protein [Tannerellaceae bacterium]
MEIRKVTKHFYSFSVLSFLLICAPSPAQKVINPSTWDSFVAGSENSVLCDTFKVQSFIPASA